MKTNEFTLKQKGFSTIGYFLGLIPLLYPIYLSEVAKKTIHFDLLFTCFGIAILIAVAFYFLAFTVKVKDSFININGVAKVPYEDIKKAYIGDFSYIESFEGKDNLPLAPFKDNRISWFFNSNKGTNRLLVIHTSTNLFFIKQNYFDKHSFIKLVLALDGKNVPLEVEESFLKEKAL
ncbi:hypothetical protein CVD28_00480 [Bacillus sp. M6-12]|uniref:hypothetical protein n=1 Tax=Bacillus sp. M6-12 TaxID=2054166 RepID=UPI000C75C285|nr:hypothetical protein [Bacillus sp. M6-12]PLS18910.1 hypothetical protein CVD28_00480 [Bacillus sp. M6-12]